jgi:hypothetical protein
MARQPRALVRNSSLTMCFPTHFLTVSVLIFFFSGIYRVDQIMFHHIQ